MGDDGDSMLRTKEGWLVGNNESPLNFLFSSELIGETYEIHLKAYYQRKNPTSPPQHSFQPLNPGLSSSANVHPSQPLFPGAQPTPPLFSSAPNRMASFNVSSASNQRDMTAFSVSGAATFAAPSQQPKSTPTSLTPTYHSFSAHHGSLNSKTPLERLVAQTRFELPSADLNSRILAEISSLPPQTCSEFYYRHYCSCVMTSTPYIHDPSQMVCLSSIVAGRCTEAGCPYQHPNIGVLKSLRAILEAEYSLLKPKRSLSPSLASNLRIRLDPQICTKMNCESDSCYLQHGVSHKTSQPSSFHPPPTSSNSVPPQPSSQPTRAPLSAQAQPPIIPQSYTPATSFELSPCLRLVKEESSDWKMVLELLIASGSLSMLSLVSLHRISNKIQQDSFDKVRNSSAKPATWTLFSGTTWMEANSIASHGFQKKPKTSADNGFVGHSLTAAPIMAYLYNQVSENAKFILLVEVVAASTKQSSATDGTQQYLVSNDDAILPRFLMKMSPV